MSSSTSSTSGMSRQVRLASLIIASSFVLSAVLGMIRQALIGSIFGAGMLLDSFYAAYRLPEMLFTLVAGGALGSAFIPVFSRLRSSHDEASAWRLASAVLTYVSLAAVVVTILCTLFASQIATLILLPSAGVEQQALTTDLMRIMLWTVVIFSVSGLVMGILNANQRFLAAALAPSMNNLGLILGALLLVPLMGVFGLAVGALLGAILHFAIQFPSLRQAAPPLGVNLKVRTPGLGEVLRLMIPRMIGAAAVQINFVVNTAIASGLEVGSLTAITVAFSLMFVILGVIGQSVGTAIFPTLAHLGAEGKIDSYRDTLAAALQNVLFTSIPAALGLLVVAPPFVALIYERGNWTTANTTSAAWALQLFALGLPAFALQEILARAFYALRDTLTPVLIAVGGMLINVVLSLLLVHWIRTGGVGVISPDGGFGGLALANVLATILESIALWWLLRRRIGSLHDGRILQGVLRTSGAALPMFGAAALVFGAVGMGSPLLALILPTAAGGAVFVVTALLVGSPEVRAIWGRLRERLGRGA